MLSSDDAIVLCEGLTGRARRPGSGALAAARLRRVLVRAAGGRRAGACSSLERHLETWTFEKDGRRRAAGREGAEKRAMPTTCRTRI